MVNRKQNYENEVNSWKSPILKTAPSENSSCEDVCKCFEKSRGPEKVEALKKWFTQRVASSKNSSFKTFSLFSQLTLFKRQWCDFKQ